MNRAGWPAPRPPRFDQPNKPAHCVSLLRRARPSQAGRCGSHSEPVARNRGSPIPGDAPRCSLSLWPAFSRSRSSSKLQIHGPSHRPHPRPRSQPQRLHHSHRRRNPSRRPPHLPNRVARTAARLRSRSARSRETSPSERENGSTTCPVSRSTTVPTLRRKRGSGGSAPKRRPKRTAGGGPSAERRQSDIPVH